MGFCAETKTNYILAVVTQPHTHTHQKNPLEIMLRVFSLFWDCLFPNSGKLLMILAGSQLI